MEKNKNKILFIVATHGDEGFSIDVFRKLEQKLPKNSFDYDWIIGNRKALKRNIRFIEADLNRSAPGNLKSKVYEEKRAAQIIKLSKRYKFVIDIHGTVANSGIVTIIPYPTLTNLLLAAALPVKKK